MKLPETRQQRIARVLAAKRRARRRRRVLIWWGAAVTVLAVVVSVTLTVAHSGGRASDAGSGALGPEGVPLQTGPALASISGAAVGEPVDGIGCDASEQVVYHIHAHLAVYVDGSPRSIPYGVGVVTPVVMQIPGGAFVQATRCYYWLHTHAADGIIHVESPTPQQYTLGNFFDIWRQPLGTTQVGPATGAVIAYVNGTKYDGDPRSIVLGEREDIQLDVGTPIVPPRPVDWTASQL